MVTYKFALVLTVVSDEDGDPVTGPVTGILGAYSTALKSRLSKYWDAISGGRVQIDWQADAALQVKETMPAWAKYEVREKVDQARAQARTQNLIPDGTEVIVIANDADTSRASTPTGSCPYVHVSLLTPSTVAHEMGHFFEWRGKQGTGHADIARDFFRDEYADPTCLMGGADDRYSFSDGMIPALSGKPKSIRSGPGMNPALVDQCGWLDVPSPRVAVVDPVALGGVTLQPWRGAPPAGAPGGAPVVAILDGWARDNGRLYICVREAKGWDRGFESPFFSTFLGQPLKLLCVYSSTPSSDSLLLGSGPATPGTTLVLGRVPLKVTVAASNAEGTVVRFEESPWRGSYPLEGVECDSASQVAVAAWGLTADAYVIDRAGKVRYNHFNGHGWEHKPWPLIDCAFRSS